LRKRLRNTLSGVLSIEDMGKVHNAFDIIGDIAIIKLPGISAASAQSIAATIMAVHRNVATVLAQTSPVTGDFRLRPLVYLRGENKTSTIHREFGCLFSVDIAHCYFSPRLSNERHRIATMIKPQENIVNMFAGAGCFSILIAKKANPAKVYSIDINPAAILYMKENIRLNRVCDRVISLQGDAKEIINGRLQSMADRVLMPLPEKALQYLTCAVSALKGSGGWIHYYDFAHATKTENSVEKTKLKAAEELNRLNVEFSFPSSRVIRTIGPNWHQVVLDIKVSRIPDKC
jgi:tRNA (guanine37-N1)-methyltransferase